MAAIPTRNFATLVGNFAAGVQGRAAALVDFSVGAVLRAVAEASADLTLWLQSVIVYVLTLTRATTSESVDLDSWYADWGFTRLPAKAATGVVIFSRFSADDLAVVPVGAEVATADGTRIYTVYADPSFTTYSADLGGYVLAAGTLNADIPVQATMPAGEMKASGWNVVSGQINTARSTVEGLDTVVNPSPLTNGLDAEKDTDYRARFALYIAGLSKGTEAAIRSAVAGVQQGLQAALVEKPGYVTVIVDDGSGAPSEALVASVRDAIGTVRAGGVQVSTIAVTRFVATVQMSVAIDPAYDNTAAIAIAGRVSTALGAYIDGLGIGKPLRFTILEHVAYGIPGVVNVTDIRLNGSTSDLIATPYQTIKAGRLLIGPIR